MLSQLAFRFSFLILPSTICHARCCRVVDARRFPPSRLYQGMAEQEGAAGGEDLRREEER